MKLNGHTIEIKSGTIRFHNGCVIDCVALYPILAGVEAENTHLFSYDDILMEALCDLGVIIDWGHKRYTKGTNIKILLDVVESYIGSE